MEDKKEKLPSTRIQWYPGHMAKTKREIIEDVKLIDVVIELLDSRIPISSRNPDIKKIVANKKKIIVLNKADLSDETINQKWVSKLSKEAPTILVDSNTGKGIEKVEDARKALYRTKAHLERSGMGFTIMESFMDSLEVESIVDLGTKITMTKKIKKIT